MHSYSYFILFCWFVMFSLLRTLLFDRSTAKNNLLHHSQALQLHIQWFIGEVRIVGYWMYGLTKEKWIKLYEWYEKLLSYHFFLKAAEKCTSTSPETKPTPSTERGSCCFSHSCMDCEWEDKVTYDYISNPMKRHQCNASKVRTELNQHFYKTDF